MPILKDFPTLMGADTNTDVFFVSDVTRGVPKYLLERRVKVEMLVSLFGRIQR